MKKVLMMMALFGVFAGSNVWADPGLGKFTGIPQDVINQVIYPYLDLASASKFARSSTKMRNWTKEGFKNIREQNVLRLAVKNISKEVEAEKKAFLESLSPEEREWFPEAPQSQENVKLSRVIYSVATSPKDGSDLDVLRHDVQGIDFAGELPVAFKLGKLLTLFKNEISSIKIELAGKLSHEGTSDYSLQVNWKDQSHLSIGDLELTPEQYRSLVGEGPETIIAGQTTYFPKNIRNQSSVLKLLADRLGTIRYDSSGMRKRAATEGRVFVRLSERVAQNIDKELLSDAPGEYEEQRPTKASRAN